MLLKTIFAVLIIFVVVLTKNFREGEKLRLGEFPPFPPKL